MSNTPLPEPVYHQWRKKKMPWSLEFAFNSMCHATTDDSEIRTLHTADQMHAHAAAVSAERDAEIAQLRADNTRLQNEVVMPLRENWMGAANTCSLLHKRIKVLEDALRAADAAFEAVEIFMPGGCKEEFAFYADWEDVRSALGDKTPNAKLNGGPPGPSV